MDSTVTRAVSSSTSRAGAGSVVVGRKRSRVSKAAAVARKESASSVPSQAPEPLVWDSSQLRPAFISGVVWAWALKPTTIQQRSEHLRRCFWRVAFMAEEWSEKWGAWII